MKSKDLVCCSKIRNWDMLQKGDIKRKILSTVVLPNGSSRKTLDVKRFVEDFVLEDKTSSEYFVKHVDEKDDLYRIEVIPKSA